MKHKLVTIEINEIKILFLLLRIDSMPKESIQSNKMRFSSKLLSAGNEIGI